ncbi:hypothetical protein EMIHUDRAFT_234169 [Emiliania huxleyi CCMP1516]|uniref:HTH La-type RNA-binding domain-containing protein n=2 Tax=Emiliania huxleyi TaxID=2903 RepID=A0A0D3JZZ9_EMIH1|nr:hypothetical protein EMIHUDRAFT_234169 [Emiliania huxleyi CCMP1516]EOD29084.1 hypothetical protein EMIHUDRAFT_234169 [Emiliania huxleyi CCMP1516]|eukprot:XP_005781513.1 hypothetical protein EMIHUDRAFT_234169 [Emiliania huxleyi CCMP1516]
MFFPQTAEQLAYMQQVQQLQRLVVAQVNYYFSDENLLRDEYLRRQMDGEGWISIELLATFNRLRSLTTDLHLIGEVLDGRVRRRFDWQRWAPPSPGVPLASILRQPAMPPLPPLATPHHGGAEGAPLTPEAAGTALSRAPTAEHPRRRCGNWEPVAKGRRRGGKGGSGQLPAGLWTGSAAAPPDEAKNTGSGRPLA